MTTSRILPAGTEHPVSVSSSTLIWAAGSYGMMDDTGLRLRLAASAVSWGIAVRNGTVLAADRGSRTLVRFTPLNPSVCLPVVQSYQL